MYNVIWLEKQLTRRGSQICIYHAMSHADPVESKSQEGLP